MLTLPNPSPGVSVASLNGAVAAVLSLNEIGITGPANPLLWTRIIAFRASGTIGAGNAARVWGCYDSAATQPGTPSGAQIDVLVEDSGMFWQSGGYYNHYGPHMQFSGSAVPTDGNWHLAVFGMDANNGIQIASIDGDTSAYQTTGLNFGVGSGTTSAPVGLNSDNIGAMVQPNFGNYANYVFDGDVAFACEIPTLMTATQIANLYGAWRSNGTGESTDARYARILRYLGYAGGTQLDSGNTRSMGPCDFSGSDGLSALQEVVDTELGQHWVQGNGTIRFASRGARYNSLSPSLIFGENTAGGEIPYEDLQFDYDPTHLANVVQITQTSTSQVFQAQDATSIANYFERLLTRSCNTTNPLECQDAAAYLVSRYKNAQMRISGLKVNLASYPTAWPSLLGLDIGTRIRVMRRPIGAPAQQVDCFVEQLQWDYDSTGKAEVTIMASPADLTPYAMFTAWRTTLAAAASSGQPTITVHPPTFDTVTPLNAVIAVGSQITVGLGGAVPETMTVKAVSATGSSWTMGTITFTANLAHSHTNGFTVNEALPTGATSVSTWDSAAPFDSVNFAY